MTTLGHWEKNRLLLIKKWKRFNVEEKKGGHCKLKFTEGDTENLDLEPQREFSEEK